MYASAPTIICRISSASRLKKFENHRLINNRANFDIFTQCIKNLRPHKDDVNYGFKSDHIINGSNKMFILLTNIFNAMLTHDFNPEDLLLSTIISIFHSQGQSGCNEF